MMKMKTYNVLLVDDDDDDYIVTRDLLEEATDHIFQLTWVDNYEEGLEKLCQNQHDAYLLDYRLGAESGLELLKEAISYGCAKPIILLTGMGNHDIDNEAIAIGASDYLVKGSLLNSPLLERSIVHSIERKQMEQERDRLFQISLDLLLIANDKGILKRINPAWEKLLGYKSHILVNQSFWNFIYPEDKNLITIAKEHLNQAQKLNSLEVRFRKKDQTYLWIAWNIVPYPQEKLLYGVGHNISQRKASEIQLVYKNRHDSLTKLDNRAYFLEKLERLINKTKNQSNNAFAVLFIDLDDFKQVNDKLGHLIGDELLIKFGEILKTSVREADSVARLGGDEFTILLTYFNHPKDVIKVIERIQEKLKIPVKLGEEQVLIRASIGIVFSNPNYHKVDEIIRDADIAMYKAKAKGKGCYEIFNSYDILN